MDTYKIKLIQRYSSELRIDPQEAITIVTGTDTPVEHLDTTDANLILRWLVEAVNAEKSKMQRKIIHQLCLYGMTRPNGSPDMERIQQYIKHIGSRNPKKRTLYGLTREECRSVLNQIYVMVKKTLYG